MDGYYIQDNWTVTKGLLLTPGIRYDTYEDRQRNILPHTIFASRGTSPSLTVTNKFTDNDILTVSLYRKFRTPAANEASWWVTYAASYGQPPLKPEKNMAEEIVFQHKFSPTSNLRFSTYNYDIKDYINPRVFPDAGRTGYTNVDKVTLFGSSVDGKTDITEWVSGRTNVTYQTSHKEGDDFDIYDTEKQKGLDYMPMWKGNLSLDFKLPNKATLSTTSRFVGTSQYLYSYKVGAVTKTRVMDINHFTTMSAEYKMPVSKNGEMSIYIDNIFNREYVEKFGYPLPGMVVGVSYKMVF